MECSAVMKGSQYTGPSNGGQSLDEAKAKLASRLGRLQLTAAGARFSSIAFVESGTPRLFLSARIVCNSSACTQIGSHCTPGGTAALEKRPAVGIEALPDVETVGQPCVKVEREMPKLHSERRLSIHGAKRISMAGLIGGNPRGDVLGTFSTNARNKPVNALAQLRQLQ